MSCTGISCNQGREPCRDGCNRPRFTCAELGVCQGRTPACSSACHAQTRVDTDHLPPGGFWIAPGVADFEPAPEPLTWLEKSLIAIAGTGVIAFVAGLATACWKGLL